MQISNEVLKKYLKDNMKLKIKRRYLHMECYDYVAQVFLDGEVIYECENF